MAATGSYWCRRNSTGVHRPHSTGLEARCAEDPRVTCRSAIRIVARPARRDRPCLTGLLKGVHIRERSLGENAN